MASRLVGRRPRTFSLRFRYGVKPKLSEETSDEMNQFEQVRFAALHENNSVFRDSYIEKFINYSMSHGRRWLLCRLMEDTMYEIKTIQYKRWRKLRDNPKQSTNEGDDAAAIVRNPIDILHMAIDNCKPQVSTKPITRGGARYQVPNMLSAAQSEWQSIKWLREMVVDRPKPRKKLFPEVMAQELIDSAYERGKAFKRKEDTHKLAQANKAYAHYRWQ